MVVSIGPKAAQETIRTALAMGCDRGERYMLRARARLRVSMCVRGSALA